MLRFCLAILFAGLILPAGTAPFQAASAATGPNCPKPSEPALQSPGNGTTVGADTVALYWQPAQPPGNDPLHYQLEIGTEADFPTSTTRAYRIEGREGQAAHAGLGILAVLLTGLLWRRFDRHKKAALLVFGSALLTAAGLYYLPGRFGDGIHDTPAVSCMIENLAHGHTYYWRVTAVDDLTQASSASTIWHFTVR